MLRICVALSVALLVPPAASAKELKPKFGDIGGVYYTDVSENREACRQAIRNKIALCRQNIDFESNTKNRKYAGCLPVFRRQAQSCIGHFRFERGKCEGAGAARIRDFTGFSCEVTATVVEEGDEPERGPDIAPMDRRMTARARVDLRAGPATGCASPDPAAARPSCTGSSWPGRLPEGRRLQRRMGQQKGRALTERSQPPSENTKRQNPAKKKPGLRTTKPKPRCLR